MIGKWGNQSFPLVIGLVYADKRWECAIVKCIINSGSKSLHVIMGQAGELISLRIIRLVIYSGKRCCKTLQIFIGEIAMTDPLQ